MRKILPYLKNLKLRLTLELTIKIIGTTSKSNTTSSATITKSKIKHKIVLVITVFLGLDFLNVDRCANALMESLSNLHFALISIKSPP
jgi:hypothetical protein